jgi:hypothetical protein
VQFTVVYGTSTVQWRLDSADVKKNESEKKWLHSQTHLKCSGILDSGVVAHLNPKSHSGKRFFRMAV